MTFMTLIALGGGLITSSTAHAAATQREALRLPRSENSWLWPVDGRRTIVHQFRAPAHDYAAGHRGIDIAAVVNLEGTAEVPVLAPADGTVAFRGVVVDRPLITIDHGGGLVTTFEPVSSDLRPGDHVAAGEQVGVVGYGGHSIRGTVHIGVRLNDVYINPMLFFGGVPRAVLLPCGNSGC